MKTTAIPTVAVTRRFTFSAAHQYARPEWSEAENPGCAAYTASKAGVLGLVRALAAEVRTRGVRVAALCPGAVDTTFWDGIPGPLDRSRMLRPEAVAEAALMVAVQPPEAFVEEIVLAPTPGVL